MRRRWVQDWSNAKEMWANPQKWGGGLAADGKMDCEERLLEQAKMTKQHAKSLGISQKVWVRSLHSPASPTFERAPGLR